MAMADYYHCDVCGGKAFYDSHISWETTMLAVNEYDQPESLVALCADCFKTHEIKIVPREKA